MTEQRDRAVAERDDIGEYRRAAHRGNPDQPIDIETLARALEAADGVQGFGGADMAMRWAERIAAEYTRLRNESQPTEERP